ncbi:MAG TPA: hypothetical protein VK925_04925 [Jiangellaceae bacterium]|nr:hypothetical protein [Jiangellaceae bacterium]
MRRLLAALLVAVAPVVVVVPLVLSWRDRLPAELASHWTVTTMPDRFTGRDGFLDGWAVAAVVAVVLGAGVVVLLRRGRRAGVTLLGAISGFLGALGLMMALPNLDVADPRQAQIGWEAALPLALMAVVAGLAWWVHGSAVAPLQPAGAPPPAHLPRLDPGEPARYDEVQVQWWLAGALFVLLAALGVAMWAAISPWLGIELIVLGALLGALARTRVRASADEDLALTGGPATHRIPIAEVTGARVLDRVDPFGEFGGWGLRYVPGTVALVLRKGAGVEVGRSGDRRAVITCADPERLAAVVNTLADQRYSLAAK